MYYMRETHGQLWHEYGSDCYPYRHTHTHIHEEDEAASTPIGFD